MHMRTGPVCRKIQHSKLLGNAAEPFLRLLRLYGGILSENGITVAILIPIIEINLLLRLVLYLDKEVNYYQIYH